MYLRLFLLACLVAKLTGEDSFPVKLFSGSYVADRIPASCANADICEFANVSTVDAA